MESQWVTFKIAQETFGFEIRYVKEMLLLPPVHTIVKAAPDHLGVIQLRSQIVSVFDLRRRFGLTSLNDQTRELVDLLRARERDHQNWVRELKASITERREFKLTTDPHQCAFGKWYDHFHTDDPWLARILRKFNDPHSRIHHVAVVAQELLAAGQYDRALALADSSTGLLLADLQKLFAEAISQIDEQNRASLIVIAGEGQTMGVAVDQIHSVITCRSEDIQPPETVADGRRRNGLVGLINQKDSDKFILLLDPVRLYPQLLIQPTAALALA
jgi:chemotaxis signal transduction protein